MERFIIVKIGAFANGVGENTFSVAELGPSGYYTPIMPPLNLAGAREHLDMVWRRAARAGEPTSY